MYGCKWWILWHVDATGMIISYYIMIYISRGLQYKVLKEWNFTFYPTNESWSQFLNRKNLLTKLAGLIPRQHLSLSLKQFLQKLRDANVLCNVHNVGNVPRKEVYLEVPRSAQKYQSVPRSAQSTQKYQSVPRSTPKYPEIPEFT